MHSNKTKVGLIGCGNISSIYCEAGVTFDDIEIAACADINLSRARSLAKQFGIPRACSVDELLADPEIAIVVNLTIPAAHADVALAAVRAGKSVYNEKPLAITRGSARELLDLAAERKLRVGCAPDTFLGGGLQTGRKLLDDGWIGEPLSAVAVMMSRGPEDWHPNPMFFYEEGGGPMLDMGPYYLTALATLLGPVKRVAGVASSGFNERVAGHESIRGTKIPVHVNTHVAGVMEFASGVSGSITVSFDVAAHRLPCLEIYGSEGSLSLPDPNTFGGPVLLRCRGSGEWKEMPLSHGYCGNSRGIGVADMALAIATGRRHRASGDLAYHVLDLMYALQESGREGRYIDISSGVERPEALPMGAPKGRLEP